jgi:transglutaminase-like putative cysteine protease
MLLEVGCRLDYEVLSPQASFTFNIRVFKEKDQRLVEEHLHTEPILPGESFTTVNGNRLYRLAALQGPLRIEYSAVADVTRAPRRRRGQPNDFALNPPPMRWLKYLLPSRFCESDRLTGPAQELFGALPDDRAKVEAIVQWLDANVAYAPGSTTSTTSALEVWQARKGVCRDFAHLGVAFCRALNIPARYFGGYALGLEPMDFHACVEAYIESHWEIFDATDNVPMDRHVCIARGRDAADSYLSMVFGTIRPGAVHVRCNTRA